MNFFEGELRKLFGDGQTISGPNFTGKICLGTLGKELRVRAEFVTTGVMDHYDAYSRRDEAHGTEPLRRTRGYPAAEIPGHLGQEARSRKP